MYVFTKLNLVKISLSLYTLFMFITIMITQLKFG